MPLLTKIRFPAVHVITKECVNVLPDRLLFGDKTIIRMTSLLDSFSPSFVGLPTTVLIKNFAELLLYAVNNKKRGYIVDNKYRVFPYPLSLKGYLTTFTIEKETDSYIKCKDAPYLIPMPYKNVEKAPLLLTIFVENMYFGIGYTDREIYERVTI